jgi:hypothetical protein
MIHLHKAIFHITTTTILPSARFCFGRMKERESKNPKLKKEEKNFLCYHLHLPFYKSAYFEEGCKKFWECE